MTLSVCNRCGGEFLPPSRARYWRWCHPCSCEGSAVNPWDSPERDWRDWDLPPEAEEEPLWEGAHMPTVVLVATRGCELCMTPSELLYWACSGHEVVLRGSGCRREPDGTVSRYLRYEEVRP